MGQGGNEASSRGRREDSESSSAGATRAGSGPCEHLIWKAPRILPAEVEAMSQAESAISRRDFLKVTGSAAVVATSAPVRELITQARTPVGVQLYCVRRELPANPAMVLGELKKIGF